MKVLITGVGGFIASKIASRFISQGFHVTGVDDFSGGKRENVPDGIVLVEGDLASKETIEKLPSDISVILHLAGQSSGEMSFDDPKSDLSKNGVSTLNLIQYGIAIGAKKLVFASSVSIYGWVGDRKLSETDIADPTSCYGVSKLAAEGYLRIYSEQLPYVNMRMFNVYGPGQDLDNLRQGMVSIYVAQAVSSGNIHVKGSLERFRDYIFIDDVVEAWFRASTLEHVQNVSLNVGTGVRTSVRQLLDIIKRELPDTKWFADGNTLGDQFGHYSDNQQIKDLLQMSEFMQLSEGMRKFVAWAIRQ